MLVPFFCTELSGHLIRRLEPIGGNQQIHARILVLDRTRTGAGDEIDAIQQVVAVDPLADTGRQRAASTEDHEHHRLVDKLFVFQVLLHRQQRLDQPLLLGARPVHLDEPDFQCRPLRFFLLVAATWWGKEPCGRWGIQFDLAAGDVRRKFADQFFRLGVGFFIRSGDHHHDPGVAFGQFLHNRLTCRRVDHGVERGFVQVPLMDRNSIRRHDHVAGRLFFLLGQPPLAYIRRNGFQLGVRLDVHGDEEQIGWVFFVFRGHSDLLVPLGGRLVHGIFVEVIDLVRRGFPPIHRIAVDGRAASPDRPRSEQDHRAGDNKHLLKMSRYPKVGELSHLFRLPRNQENFLELRHIYHSSPRPVRQRTGVPLL